MQTFPLRPFLPFLPASFPPRVTLGRHPLPLSRPSIYFPASHPAILPSGHRAIHLAFFPSLSLLAAPAFFPGLVPGSVLLGLPSRGRAPTPVSSTAPARQFFPGVLFWLLPETLDGELFQNRLVCRSPSARLPSASCRLTLASLQKGVSPWMSSRTSLWNSSWDASGTRVQDPVPASRSLLPCILWRCGTAPNCLLTRARAPFYLQEDKASFSLQPHLF